MLKLSKPLYHSNNDDCFHQQILPDPDRKATMLKVKEAIRNHLYQGIRKASVTVLQQPRMVSPKFRTQGSWAYNTQVMPAQASQEMDIDYGVYLPVEVWAEQGPPAAMAKAYFDLVEGLLKGLCDQKGWTLVEGKDTCARVKFAAWGHIDIPLYAAPESELVHVFDSVRGTLLEKAASFEEYSDADVIEEQQWEELQTIVMATRSGQWKESDPEKVARWFRTQVERNGEQLRRVCRYFKAWRDHKWESGGPTSVSLMIAICQDFSEKTGRDDLCVEDTAARLATRIQGEIRENAIDEGQEDFNRLSADDRPQASQWLRNLAGDLREARQLQEHDKQLALAALQSNLGERVPADLALIEPDTAYAAAVAQQARPVPRPLVLSTSAG